MRLTDINFKKLFLIYIIFLIFCSIYFLFKTYPSTVNNSMAEWVINYSGGFGRRGFLGEILSNISIFFDLPYRKLIFIFLSIVFCFYYGLIYFFIKNIILNKWIILVILSPLFLIFPIAELEALGRKDILIPFFFIIYIFFNEKFNFYLSVIFLIFIYSILLLTHEVSMFYVQYFYIILLLKHQTLNLNKILTIILISILFLSIIYLLSQSIHSEEKFNLLCQNLKENFNEKCGLGAFMLKRTLSENILEVKGFDQNHILTNLIIFIIGYIVLILFTINSEFKSTNILSRFFNFKVLSLLLFIPTILPFFIVVDWGRWYNLSYTMSALYLIFNIKYNKVLFTESIFLKRINYFLFSTKKKFFLFLIIFCFSWNPKAVYHEDIGSIPIYRAILKIHKYF